VGERGQREGVCRCRRGEKKGWVRGPVLGFVFMPRI
jgi:hypothetical protein